VITIELVGGCYDGEKMPAACDLTEYGLRDLNIASETGPVPYVYDSTQVIGDNKFIRFIYDREKHLNPLL